MCDVRRPRGGRPTGTCQRLPAATRSSSLAPDRRAGVQSFQRQSSGGVRLGGYTRIGSFRKMATTTEESYEAPEWLDHKFIADILSREEGRSVSVRQLRVARAVTKGENYASLLLRVGVDYDEDGSTGDSPKTTSLIVKSLPIGEIMQQFLRESGAFDRETRMYFSTIPALEAILNEKIPEEKVVFGPKFLPCDRDHTIVLRDLSNEGFRMTNRHVGMDLEHATMVLRNLARLHAASVALHARDPEQAESYTDIFYRPESREQVDKFIPPTIERVATAVDNWNEERFAGYAEKIRAFSKVAVDEVMEAVRPSKTFLNVLNHGDCWVNNSLFRYAENDGKLLEMRFIDFQVVRYGPPSLDLQYFLYTSVQAGVREQHWAALLGSYAAQLRETLEALGLGERAVTVDALEADMRARASFGIVSACTVLSAVLAAPADAIDLEGLTSDDFEKDSEVFAKALAGRRFHDALKRLLPMFVKDGSL